MQSPSFPRATMSSLQHAVVRVHSPQCPQATLSLARLSLGAPSSAGSCDFSENFFQSITRRFASLTCLFDSGRFHTPFSYNELVAALSKFHESAPGADCFPYSAFKIHFPWWRHLLLSFFNLILQYALVSSAWKSSLVVPVVERDGDPTSLDSFRSTSLASCAFQGLRAPCPGAQCAPHIFPQLDFSQGGFRWGVDALELSILQGSCVSAVTCTLLLHSSISSKFLARPGWKLPWSVLTMSGSPVASGTCLPTSSAAHCPKCAFATQLPSLWVDTGIAQGRVLSPLLFDLLVGSLAIHFPRLCSWCPPCWILTLSGTYANSMRTTWSPWPTHKPTCKQPSMLCTPVGFAGGFPLVLVPPNLRSWSPVLSAVVQTAPRILAASPCHSSHSTNTMVLFFLSTLSWRTPTLTSSALAATASATSPVLGALERVLLSYVISLCSCFGLEFIGNGSSALHQFNLSATGVVISLGGPARLPSLQSTRSLALATLFASPSDVRSPSLVVCVPWTTLHLASPYPCHYLPTLFQRAMCTWSHWCASALRSLSRSRARAMSAFLQVPLPRLSIARFLAKPAVAWTTTCATGSQPWHKTSMVSLLRPFPTTLSPPWRTPPTVATSPPLRCVCGALPAGDPLILLAVLLATCVDLSPALPCRSGADGSPLASPLCLRHSQ